MKFPNFASKSLVAAVLATGVALTGAAPAAAANAPRYVFAYTNGVCDTATGEWAITWLLNNQSDESVAVSDLLLVPGGPAAEAFPTTLAPGATNATQRMLAVPGRTASLDFTVAWADGQTQRVQWAFRPRTLCNKAA